MVLGELHQARENDYYQHGNGDEAGNSVFRTFRQGAEMMDAPDPGAMQEDGRDEAEGDGIEEEVGVEPGVVPPFGPAPFELATLKLEIEDEQGQGAHRPEPPQQRRRDESRLSGRLGVGHGSPGIAISWRRRLRLREGRGVHGMTPPWRSPTLSLDAPLLYALLWRR